MQWKGAPSQLGAMHAQLAKDELALGLGGFDVMPDDADYANARTVAALAAQSAGTDANAVVAAYVAAMPLADVSIDRDVLTARVLSYL